MQGDELIYSASKIYNNQSIIDNNQSKIYDNRQLNYYNQRLLYYNGNPVQPAKPDLRQSRQNLQQ